MWQGYSQLKKQRARGSDLSSATWLALWLWLARCFAQEMPQSKTANYQTI
jgi:hypothetical protein